MPGVGMFTGNKAPWRSVLLGKTCFPPSGLYHFTKSLTQLTPPASPASPALHVYRP